MIQAFPVDKAHLERARAAIRAGDFDLAAEEVAKIRLSLQQDVAVTQARWLLNAAAGKWAVCLPLARQLVAEKPDYAPCWVALAKSLIRTEQWQEAHAVLTRVRVQFPEEAAFTVLLRVLEQRLEPGLQRAPE